MTTFLVTVRSVFGEVKDVYEIDAPAQRDAWNQAFHDRRYWNDNVHVEPLDS